MPTLAAIFTPDQPPERLGAVAADVAATVGDYARADATCIGVDTGEDGTDLERFVAFLAGEVKPLLS
jgi:hypothetical protein